MSYSAEIKGEILKQEMQNSCCEVSFLSGFLCFCATVFESENYSIKFLSENHMTVEKVTALIKKIYGISPTVNVREHKKSVTGYIVYASNCADMLTDMGILSGGRLDFRAPIKNITEDCCVASFLRGAFLGGGSISIPQKHYHLEFCTNHFLLAREFINLFKHYDITAKSVMRKSNYVIYFKDSDSICDILAAMGVFTEVMNIYNIKILKEVNNRINREQNCEMANIEKTIDASLKQCRAINFIIEKKGIGYLPKNLKELALIRIENPDANLTELGEMLSISKSGVNHRLRKIMMIAKELEK